MPCSELYLHVSAAWWVMSKNSLAFWMTLAGTVCWGVCFWWMRRLSIKQNVLLDQLRSPREI